MDSDEVRYHAHLHLGIAVDAPDGLIVPVVPDAGALNLVGLAQAIADRARRAREGALTPDEVSGATFTLTNTGSRGALFDTPILTPPQTGILGTGAVVKRVRVVSYDGDGESLAVRHICHLALSYDHRLVDGADAARFLATMRTRLQAGQFELLLPAGS